MRSYKINQKFGEKVKKIRRKKDISQEELAEKLKISRNHVGRIERGETNVTLVLIEKIARSLKVNPSKLLPF